MHQPLFENLKSELPVENQDASESISEETTPLDVIEPKPFDIDPKAYQGIVGEIVKFIDPHTEADPVAMLVQLLMGCGSIVGRTAHAVYDTTPHYLNLFTVIVGYSSTSRKGTSWDWAFHVLSQVDETWAKTRVLGGLTSGEGIVQHIRDPLRGVPVVGKGSQSRKAVIVDPGVKDKRLFCLEHEFASVLRSLERQSNSLSARIREAWDGRRLGSLAKNCPMFCQEPHVSINAQSNPADLRRYLNQVEIFNGFGNRFLWIYVARTKDFPHGSNITLDKTLITELTRAIHWAKTLGCIKRDQRANRLWEEVYRTLRYEQDEVQDALLGRAPAQLLRLSTAYAVLDYSSEVKLEHLQAALAIWEYNVKSVKFIFGSKRSSNTAETLHRHLLEKGSLTRTQISNLFHKNKSSDEITKALYYLGSKGLASQRIETGTGGGPREIWHIPDSTKRTN